MFLVLELEEIEKGIGTIAGEFDSVDYNHLVSWE
jgi:hypothetical protein